MLPQLHAIRGVGAEAAAKRVRARERGARLQLQVATLARLCSLERRQQRRGGQLPHDGLDRLRIDERRERAPRDAVRRQNTQVRVELAGMQPRREPCCVELLTGGMRLRPQHHLRLLLAKQPHERGIGVPR